MSQFLCITELKNIRVSEALGRGDRLGDDIFLTNDGDVVRQKLSRGMRFMFGRVEMDALARADLVAYRMRDVEAEKSSQQAEISVLQFLGEMRGFQLCLWILKDNAGTVENAFLEWPYRDPGAIFSVNQWAGNCTDAAGTSEIVTFGREELRAARLLNEKLWAPGGPRDFRPAEPVEPTASRFSRALYFIQAARGSPALSVKVANYCSALESVLSTDASELSHKLAERVAWLVAPSLEERMETYRKLKTAYGIRSKAVHGSQLSQRKIDGDLRTASRDCDQLLRQVLGRIMVEPTLRRLYLEGEEAQDELENHLLATTFGKPLAPDGGGEPPT